MMKEVQEGTRLKLGDAPWHPQEIFKKTQASKLGDALRHPLLHQQLLCHLFWCYIFTASHDMCCSWSVFYFVFSFFVLFAGPSMLVRESATLHFFLEYSCASIILVEYSVLASALLVFSSCSALISC